MKPLNYKKVIKILKNLGFEHARKIATSHEAWRFFRNGRWHSVTVCFHGQKHQFPPNTLKSMIRQSGFSEEKFYKALKKRQK